jgi:hypothetical protein
MMNQLFLAKNQQNTTHFFTYGLFCCKLLYVEIFLLKVILKKIQEGVITFMPIDYNFKKFLK